MNKSVIDVILHPVRIRVIQSLVNGQNLTAQDIGELLSDVPQATLYRHISKLVEAEIIEVVDKNQIRGTVEKVYSLSKYFNQKTNDEFINSSKEEQTKIFLTFLLGLLGEFKNYLNQEDYDFVEDGLSFRQVSIYANDEEFKELAENINNAILKYIHNKPSENRSRRTMATIIIPE